jgi:hypothetical protein
VKKVKGGSELVTKTNESSCEGPDANILDKLVPESGAIYVMELTSKL